MPAEMGVPTGEGLKKLRPCHPQMGMGAAISPCGVPVIAKINLTLNHATKTVSVVFETAYAKSLSLNF